MSLGRLFHFSHALTLKKFCLMSSLAAGIVTFTVVSRPLVFSLHRLCSLFWTKHRGPPPISPSWFCTFLIFLPQHSPVKHCSCTWRDVAWNMKLWNENVKGFLAGTEVLNNVAYYFLKVHFHHSSQALYRSHKTVEIKGFLTIFAWWWEDPDPYPGTCD